MDSNTVTISELISGMLSEARRLGLSESTIWRDWEPKANSVVMYYRKRGLCVYSSEVTEEYLKSCEQRYETGELAYSSLHQIRQILRRIHEYYVTGTLRAAGNTRRSRYTISPANEHLVDAFIAEYGYGKNTCNDVAWVVKRYLHYFESLGHSSLATVTVEDVQQYILKTASEMKLNSLHDVFLYLRHFHAYLKEDGYIAPDCVELFSHKMQREKHVQGYVTDEELEKILGVIDKESEKGKRDYAIIPLAATTGMRACDIIRLKLTDVDWRRGEIAIVQDKTGNKVCLPILHDVGVASQDYILHVRPSIPAPELFLTTRGIRGPIVDAMAIGDMFRNYEAENRGFSIEKKLCQLFWGIKSEIADFPHFCGQIREFQFSPGCKANGNTKRMSHFPCQLHVIYHQDVIWFQAEYPHYILQREGIWLPKMLRIIPAVDGIRLNAEMNRVISCDVSDAGVGNNTNKSPLLLLAANDLPNSGKNIRNMGKNIVHPPRVLQIHFLLGKPPMAATHFRKPEVMAVMDIIGKRNGRPRAELTQNLAKVGVSYGFLRLHHSVIVIQNQASVFCHMLPSYRFIRAFKDTAGIILWFLGVIIYRNLLPFPGASNIWVEKEFPQVGLVFYGILEGNVVGKHRISIIDIQANRFLYDIKVGFLHQSNMSLYRAIFVQNPKGADVKCTKEVHPYTF